MQRIPAACRFAHSLRRPALFLAKRHASSSVDESELRKFTQQSEHWWRDTSGPFAALHSLNHIRVPLIQQALNELSVPRRDIKSLAGVPLGGCRVLDVGCGGGILSEALARLGANVLGIDAALENVRAALHHRDLDPRLAARLAYEVVTVEDLLTRNNGATLFDAVVSSEVLEHVRNPEAFVTACAGLVRVSGVDVVYLARFMKHIIPHPAAWWRLHRHNNKPHRAVLSRSHSRS